MRLWWKTIFTIWDSVLDHSFAWSDVRWSQHYRCDYCISQTDFIFLSSWYLCRDPGVIFVCVCRCSVVLFVASFDYPILCVNRELGDKLAGKDTKAISLAKLRVNRLRNVQCACTYIWIYLYICTKIFHICIYILYIYITSPMNGTKYLRKKLRVDDQK